MGGAGAPCHPPPPHTQQPLQAALCSHATFLTLGGPIPAAPGESASPTTSHVPKLGRITVLSHCPHFSGPTAGHGGDDIHLSICSSVHAPVHSCIRHASTHPFIIHPSPIIFPSITHHLSIIHPSSIHPSIIHHSPTRSSTVLGVGGSKRTKQTKLLPSCSLRSRWGEQRKETRQVGDAQWVTCGACLGNQCREGGGEEGRKTLGKGDVGAPVG